MNQLVKFRNGKVAKNPFAMASLTNGQSNADGTLNDQELQWLIRRAQGGYGIINTCCVHVQANGKGWEGELGCFSDDQIPGFQEITQAIKAVDPETLLIVQVFHGGMRADDELFEGPARSCVDTEYHHRGGVRPVKGFTAEEIEQLEQDFIQACVRSQKAGVDGVELHGAHGYLLTQFLDSELNTRTDKWGGKSLENRARLLRRIAQGARKACGDDFIIGVRLSPETGFEKAGWNMDPDEILQVAKWLAEDDGVDYISVSVLGHSPSHVTKHSHIIDNKPLAQIFREALPTDVVVMCCGGIKSAQDVQTLLDMGIDMAVMGKTAIGSPDFPKLCQEDPAFEVTDEATAPWTAEYLESVKVSRPFVDMLGDLYGLVKKDISNLL